MYIRPTDCIVIACANSTNTYESIRWIYLLDWKFPVSRRAVIICAFRSKSRARYRSDELHLHVLHNCDMMLIDDDLSEKKTHRTHTHTDTDSTKSKGNHVAQMRIVGIACHQRRRLCGRMLACFIAHYSVWVCATVLRMCVFVCVLLYRCGPIAQKSHSQSHARRLPVSA